MTTTPPPYFSAPFIIAVAGSLAVALGRFAVPGHPLTGWPGFYEALAHVWCGWLIGAGCFAQARAVRLAAWACLAAVSALELVAFLCLAQATG